MRPASIAFALSVSLAACTTPSLPAAPVIAPSPATAPAPPRDDPYGGTFGSLTGLPVSIDQADRRVIVVPFAAGFRARGLDAADFVVVEAAPDGVRTIGLYQTNVPRWVGPVGPLRPLAGKVATTADAIIAAAGGEKFSSTLMALGQRDASIDAEPHAYRGRSSRRMVRPAALWAAEPHAGRSGSLLAFAHEDDAFATAGQRQASSLHAETEGRVFEWRFSVAEGAWRSQPGSPCPPSQSVIVQQVPFKDLRVDRNGTIELAAQVLGRGEATVVSGGLGIAATWSRPTYQSITNFIDPSGTPLRFHPGRTCVVLVPTETVVGVS